jgi:ATP-binding cassette subfamily B protein
MPTDSNKSPSTSPGSAKLLWRCFLYLKPYARLTAGVYLAMLVINGINLVMPQLIRWIIDEGIYGGRAVFLIYGVLGLLGLALLKAILIYIQGGWTEVASQNVAYDLRNEIMQQLTALSFSFHDRMETGQILSRAIQDVERIRFLTGRAVLRIVEGLMLMIGTAVVLIWMNPILGGLVMLILPLLVHRAYVFGSHFRPLSLDIQQQLGVLTTRIEQNLRGAQVVKGFAQEAAEIERFQEDNERWFDLSRQAIRLQAVNVPLLSLIANFGTVVIILYGGVLVTRGEFTLGELVAFITYLAMLVRPLNLVGRIIPIFAIAASAAERIFEILDMKPEVYDSLDALDLPRIQGQVRFSEVCFGYDHDRAVLEDISFEVQPGQVVALLGTTGSGKSTIANLVARFYDPAAGVVLIDGHDSRSIRLQSLRAQTGFVLQDTILFAASIRENIAFGKPDADEGEIIAAAEDAQAHSFIAKLPDGYDTQVGERGTTLSGGQKQRIAIARALLTDPRILILDDATSSVDSHTEILIQKAITRLMHGRTTFVIAHRLSTVRKADLILVLEKGRIVTRGTHQSLLEESEKYAEIYHLQLRPQEEDTTGADL